MDATTAVRSGDFFSSSTAHAGQPRCQLDPGGTWTALTDSTNLAAASVQRELTAAAALAGCKVEVDAARLAAVPARASAAPRTAEAPSSPPRCRASKQQRAPPVFERRVRDRWSRLDPGRTDNDEGERI